MTDSPSANAAVRVVAAMTVCPVAQHRPVDHLVALVRVGGGLAMGRKVKMILFRKHAGVRENDFTAHGYGDHVVHHAGAVEVLPAEHDVVGGAA